MNARQYPIPWPKLPATTEMFGYTTDHRRTANSGHAITGTRRHHAAGALPLSVVVEPTDYVAEIVVAHARQAGPGGCRIRDSPKHPRARFEEEPGRAGGQGR